MFLTIAMLNLTSSVKEQDAHSSLVLAAALVPNLMISAQVAARDVLPLVEEVVTATVTLYLITADTTNLVKIMIVRMMMLTTMLLYPAFKCSAEKQEASASLVLSALEVAAARTLSASSTLVQEVVHPLNSKCKLEATLSPVLKKDKEL